MSRLVSLLTFGLGGGKRSGSMDAISAAAKRRISTLADGDTGDYSSYSSETPDMPPGITPATSNPPSQPPSPDPHEAYILPASFTPPNHSSTARTYSATTPHSNSMPPVLTGDATLDIYKQELDLLSRETDHIRGSISAYAKQLIDMALHCTDVAEKAYDVCEAANFFPPTMKLYMKTHRGLSEQAAYLFGSQLEEDIMQPIAAWDEQVDSFIRELTRTNQVRLTMMEHRKLVDAQFLRKCDRPKDWSDDEEYALKVSKSDLEATCNNYMHRCEGLVVLWRNIALDRMKALDAVFTRLLTQQYALFHPPLVALTTSGLPGLPTTALSSPTSDSTTTPGTLQIPTQSPLTPPTPSGRLRAYSGDGTNVRKRSAADVFDENQRQLLLSQFSPPNKIKRKQEAQRRLKLQQQQLQQQQQQQREDESDDDDRQDAILQTLELMKIEIREKERIQSEMEQLIKQQAESREKEEGEEAARLRDRLEELERKLEEKEREIASNQSKIAEAKEAEEHTPPDDSGVVVGSDAPPPPPMDDSAVPFAPPLDDVPPAPPMFDIPDAPPPPDAPPLAPGPPNAPPGAPSAPSMFGAVKKLTARDKEVAEAKRHHLPVLPAVKAPDGVSVKRLHWSVVPAAEVKGTVWEQLVNPTPTDSSEQADGDEDDTAGWELPLIKKEESTDSEQSSDASANDGSELQWHWALGDEFGHTFAQKASKPLNNKDKKKRKSAKTNNTAANTTEQDDSSDEADGDDNEEDEERKLRQAAEAKLKKQIERVELIDAKRAYNVAISLSHFRLDYVLIRNAVMLMDSELLSLEQLEVLLDILPTAEEVKVVQEYTGDVERLGDVERFFLALSVPTLSTRLKAFVFMQTFPPLTASLHDAMSLLHMVNGRLRDSRNVRALLGIVLRMGNYMSASNGQAQCYGFQLSTLSKLRGVKSVDNKTTLLHYLVSYVQHHCPQVRNFTQELSGCRAASRIESAFLIAEVKQLQQNVRMVKALIDDDHKRRAPLSASQQHFDFTPTASATADTFNATGPASLFSPLSAPSLTPLNVTQPIPGGALSSTFNFSQELMTPASALATASFPADALPPIPDRLLTFYATTAAPATGGLERQLSNVQSEYAALQCYYVCGEVPWEQFYGLWSLFVDEWLAVEEEMEVERERETRRRRQAESAEAMVRKKREKAAEAAASKAERDENKDERLRRTSSEVKEVLPKENKEEEEEEDEVTINMQPMFALEIDPVDVDLSVDE